MNLLFVCSRNRRRSPTAEAVFSGMEGHSFLSAGTSPDADTPVSADLIEWADMIFAMEAVHRRRLNQRFPALLRAKRIIVLAIPDQYNYMDQSPLCRIRVDSAECLSNLGFNEAATYLTVTDEESTGLISRNFFFTGFSAAPQESSPIVLGLKDHFVPVPKCVSVDGAQDHSSHHAIRSSGSAASVGGSPASV